MLCAINLNAQEQTYTVNGTSYHLKTEVKGPLSLLWNVIEGQPRFFLKKDSSINELVNTKSKQGAYNKEYITTLKAFTIDKNVSYNNVAFLLSSLKDFVLQYNALVENKEVDNNERIVIKTRLGFSTGITNHPFVTNPNNDSSLQVGAELELYDNTIAKRHAAYINLTHGFENKDLEYTITQLSLGYRFRFIYTTGFNIYANATLATFNYAERNITFLNEQNLPTTKKQSASNFDAPVIFGLGADIKLGKNGFLTLSYDELVALFFNNKGNFSTDFSIGYKFNL